MRTKQLVKAHAIWRGGKAHVPPSEEDERAWQSANFPSLEEWENTNAAEPSFSPSVVLGEGAVHYWTNRQESRCSSLPGLHVGTDGSSHGSGEPGVMGAAMVFIPTAGDQDSDSASSSGADDEVKVARIQVGGQCWSFRAEAAAMWLALTSLDSDIILNIYTDSMNVIDTIRKWQRKEFLANMLQQKNSDIIMPLLEALNERTKETHIIKVKAQRACGPGSRGSRLR